MVLMISQSSKFLLKKLIFEFDKNRYGANLKARVHY